MTHILIVDDSPTEIHILRTMLERHGYQVTSANNGRDGVAKAKEVLPDLVLMDVVMPDVSGFQATRQLSKAPETSSIPVVMVTTKGQETDKIWGLRQGARDYMVKPVKEQALIEKIQAVLGG
jgi:twitching motility two-component system response regulator PilH